MSEEGDQGGGPKHPIGRMLALGVVLSLIGVAIVLAIDWTPPQAATNGKAIDLLYDVTLVLSVPIFILVMTIVIYSVIRFRARPGDKTDGAPIHGNARLEVIWVAIPTIIVSALAVYAFFVLEDIEAKQPNAMPVQVRGQQFAWNFNYPANVAGNPKAVASNELVLPVNRPVEFKIEAVDVIHSFWVPAFRLKSDAVPGVVTELRVTPSQLGRYDVVCAELCGLGHSTMRQIARVVSEEEFAAFLAKGTKAPNSSLGTPGEPSDTNNLGGG